ncbi:MAG: toprim domain-containing protein [Nanoarchaeota archaeon]
MENFIEWIDEINSSNKLIIVEGKKDLISLKKLDIKNNIIMLSKKPLYLICEEISNTTKDVIILTDFDKKGIELYKKLNINLQNLGVKIDKKYRIWLKKNTKISHIEGISKLLKYYK